MATTDANALPQGSFTLVLGSLRCVNAREADKAPSYWANVEILTGTERSTAFWWATNPDTAHRANTSVISALSSGDEEFPSFHYSQASKTFALTDPALIPTLCATTARISLYEGTSQDKDADKLVHTLDLPLKSIVVAQQLDKTIAFTDDIEIHVALAFDASYIEYFQGFKALVIQSGTIRNLPQDWKLVPKEGEDIAVSVGNPEVNAAKYSAIIQFPSVDPAQPSLQLSLEGRLALNPDVPDVDQAWHVPMTPTDASLLWFLSKPQYERFLEWMEAKTSAVVVIQRTQGADVWTASSAFTLSPVLVPGTDQFKSVAPLTQGIAPTRESLEEALAKATSNDDKKKAQAALNDYENLLGRIAGQAATYVSAGTELELQAHLQPGAWIPLPPVPTPPSMTLAELIPPREPLPPYPQKDAQEAMHKELRRIISLLMKEYDRLFVTEDKNKEEHGDEDDDEDEELNLSKEDRRQKLIFHLNSEGIYFDFKEKLKKALVAVIREKFPTIIQSATSGPQNALGSDTPDKRQERTDFYSQLYSYLMEEVHVVLNGIFHGREVHEAKDESPQALKAKSHQMQLQAYENEVNGRIKKATTLHMDRLNLIESHLASLADLHAPVWYDFALFHLRMQDLTKAGECLRTCISIDPSYIDAIHAYGALLCQNREFHAADIVLKNALTIEPSPTLSQQARGHGLLALYYTISESDATGNLCLHELMQAVSLESKSNSSTFPSPSSICIDIGGYCKELSLYALASNAIELHAKMMKPKTVLSTLKHTTLKLVNGWIALHFQNIAQAYQSSQDAIEQDRHNANGWYLNGVISSQQNNLQQALASYAQALACIETLAPIYHLPLYLQLGALYMHHQQWGPAKTIFLQACRETSVASAWLGVGVVCVRQDDWEGAEMALAEANVLDHTNADVWGYLALVCLNATPPRQREAELALEQALRYELTNATLLRELSNGFVALDMLETAESLLRRSLLTGDTSLTRKTLADVLAAQNCAETALEQYQKALEKSESMSERTNLLNECANLLTTLGRLDQAKEYRAMAQHQQEGAENEILMDQHLRSQ